MRLHSAAMCSAWHVQAYMLCAPCAPAVPVRPPHTKHSVQSSLMQRIVLHCIAVLYILTAVQRWSLLISKHFTYRGQYYSASYILLCITCAFQQLVRGGASSFKTLCRALYSAMYCWRIYYRYCTADCSIVHFNSWSEVGPPVPPSAAIHYYCICYSA